MAHVHTEMLLGAQALVAGVLLNIWRHTALASQVVFRVASQWEVETTCEASGAGSAKVFLACFYICKGS